MPQMMMMKTLFNSCERKVVCGAMELDESDKERQTVLSSVAQNLQ
jgi:hypothetical protein